MIKVSFFSKNHWGLFSDSGRVFLNCRKAKAYIETIGYIYHQYNGKPNPVAMKKVVRLCYKLQGLIRINMLVYGFAPGKTVAFMQELDVFGKTEVLRIHGIEC